MGFKEPREKTYITVTSFLPGVVVSIQRTRHLSTSNTTRKGPIVVKYIATHYFYLTTKRIKLSSERGRETYTSYR